MRPQDLRYVYRARRSGARFAWRIVEEARRANVPLSWAFALVEQESDFRCVFGHDQGSILHGQKVTRERVRRLLAHIARGGVPNGVGLTQLTSPGYVKDAERRGGAHRPRINLRVGFEVFNEKTGRDYRNQAWKYNGSPAYQAQILAKQRRWHDLLT